MMNLEDVNAMLTAGGAPACKFPEIGTAYKGQIVSAEKRQSTDLDTGKPRTWDNGDPMWEIVITIDTDQPDDDGETKRRLFVRGHMLKAVREAVKESGSAMEIGGTLHVKYHADGEASRKGFNAPKLFKAKYSPPAPPAVDLDEL